jgi:predicted DNA binding CopG/RHH family protein
MVKKMTGRPEKIDIPEFQSEAQEAAWWDEHQSAVEENLMAAMQDGTIQRGTAQRLVQEAQSSKNITIRMPLADPERAQRLSAKKGLGSATFMKQLLHEALEREDRASAQL